MATSLVFPQWILPSHFPDHIDSNPYNHPFSTTTLQSALIYIVRTTIFIFFLSWIIRRIAFYKSPVHVIYSSSSAKLPSNAPNLRQKTIVDALKSSVPSLFGPNAYFEPMSWLKGGHLQTMYCSIGDFTNTDPIDYQRIFFRVPEGGVVSLDIHPPLDLQPAMSGEKVAVVMHGLTGGSHESYIRAALASITKPKKEGGLGMRAVVMNFRGCAGTPVVTRRLYHCGETDDLRSTMLYLSHKLFPQSQFFGVAFSLGANAMVKYCGEEGENCPLSAVVSVANPWDFLRANYHIGSGPLINRYVYDLILGGALQMLLVNNKGPFLSSSNSHKQSNRSPISHQEPCFPHIPVEDLLVAKIVTCRYFDDRVTAPVFGFKSAWDNYSQVSSVRFIDRVRVPVLGLNARDDPIVHEGLLPDCQVYASPWVVLATTSGGGHMGWFEKGWQRWFVKPIHQFLDVMLQSDLQARPMPKALPPDEFGMVRQAGRPDIGYLPVGPNDFHVPSGDGQSKMFSGW